MRVSQFFVVVASLAVAVSAGIPVTGDGSTPTSLDLVSSPSSLPVATAVGVHGSSEQQPASSSSNATVVVASSHSLQSAAGASNHSSTLTAGTSLRTAASLGQNMPADT